MSTPRTSLLCDTNECSDTHSDRGAELSLGMLRSRGVSAESVGDSVSSGIPRELVRYEDTDTGSNKGSGD